VGRHVIWDSLPKLVDLHEGAISRAGAYTVSENGCDKLSLEETLKLVVGSCSDPSIRCTSRHSKMIEVTAPPTVNKRRHLYLIAFAIISDDVVSDVHVSCS